MCSHSGFVFILIASLIVNCLHFGIVGGTTAADTSRITVHNISKSYNNNIHNSNNSNDNSKSGSGNNANDGVLKSSNLNGRHLKSIAGQEGHHESFMGSGALRIDLTRKRSIHLNGIEIPENSVVDHLEDHEHELIFGKRRRVRRSLRLVLLNEIGTEASAACIGATGELDTSRVKRVKRADNEQPWRRPSGAPKPRQQQAQQQPHQESGNTEHNASQRKFATQEEEEEVSVNIKDEDRHVRLRLRPTPKLIDDAFIFIRRFANSSQFIEDSHKLAERYERCLYSTENAALDLCDRDRVRGIFHHNDTDFIIHPLPARFGNSSHVIYESEPDEAFFDESIQFEPNYEDFNELPRDHQSNKSQRLGIERRHKLNSHYYHNHHHRRHRARRHIATGADWKIPQVLHIETAIFVDNDLFKHMAKNFPKNTESHLIRFVLAIVNGVQVLYHHPSLGHRINFVLKRLEILYKEPKDLRRSSDIDTYLSNFCMWQKSLNPPSDADAVHYDHAVILTGLDLYVVGKNRKVISQVVGLAPVAGMCTPTSSCTINEGKHFESVFVVAHEIGHNLGMRHDTKDNSCDPSLYIMSPTLGSGKITWSKCSRTYLNTFLETPQAKCLFDRGQFIHNLDHSAEGMLPGERFEADQQCMLKYGKDSTRARNQVISDICRDLHCQRDRYTWTSHPALEGTECGDSMWCRSGVCAARPATDQDHSSHKVVTGSAKPAYDKASFVESGKVGHLLHEYNFNKSPTWGEWGEASECDSGCLYGPSKRLREGSTGLRTFWRSCLDYRRRCLGRDRKFESCIAKQCYSIPITTIQDFASQVCEKAQKFDTELTGEGEQIVGDIEESCKVFCRTKLNGTKSRSWTFPDGTTCRSKLYSYGDTAYCIAGRCEKFSCDNSTHNYYKIDPIFCQNRSPQLSDRIDRNDSEHHRPSKEPQSRRSDAQKHIQSIHSRYAEGSTDYNRENINSNKRVDSGIYGPTTVRSKYENEVAVRPFHGRPSNEQSYKRKSDSYSSWSKYNYRLNEPTHQPQLSAHTNAPPPPSPYRQPAPPSPPMSASLVRAAFESETEWIVKSGCHSSCMAKSRGVQVVQSRRTGTNNIQLCTTSIKPCEHLLTPTEFAESTCSRYKLKVRGLSGYGTQIAASIEEPDRSCRVGCQDEFLKYRYYLVNGKNGHFPLGTKCSHTEERYCINGKCLEFGPDNIPLQQSHITLALFRSKRSLGPTLSKDAHDDHLRRAKRSFLNYAPVNITETITQDFINNIVDSIIDSEQRHVGGDETAMIMGEHIEFMNPIHISIDDQNSKN